MAAHADSTSTMADRAGDSLELHLPSIDAAARTALNTWLAARSAPVFRGESHDYEVHWLAEQAVKWQFAVELAAGSHAAIITFDSLAAFEPLLIGEPFTLLPAALRDLAVQRLLAGVLVHAPRTLRDAIEVRAIHWDARRLPDWPCRLAFSLRRRPDGAFTRGCLMLEAAAGLIWLHESLPVDSSSARARLNVRVMLNLLLGHSTVPAEELAGLQDGDVAWIETASITRDGIAMELMAPAARRSWRGRARHQSLRIAAVSDDDGALERAVRAAAIRGTTTGAQAMSVERLQLDVRVTFELGELQLKMQELERLQPGQIVDLPQDVADTTVSLRVAGRRIAEGTLLVVGKRLGVRIARTLVPATPSAG